MDQIYRYVPEYFAATNTGDGFFIMSFLLNGWY